MANGEEETKTILVKLSTWQELSTLKIETNAESLDAVIVNLLKTAKKKS